MWRSRPTSSFSIIPLTVAICPAVADDTNCSTVSFEKSIFRARDLNASISSALTYAIYDRLPIPSTAPYSVRSTGSS